MTASRKENWRELHENEVIRASLGGIRKLASWRYKKTLPFSFAFKLVLFATEYMQGSTKKTLDPYDLVFVQLAPVFSAWRPF